MLSILESFVDPSFQNFWAHFDWGFTSSVFLGGTLEPLLKSNLALSWTQVLHPHWLVSPFVPRSILTFTSHSLSQLLCRYWDVQKSLEGRLIFLINFWQLENSSVVWRFHAHDAIIEEIISSCTMRSIHADSHGHTCITGIKCLVALNPLFEDVILCSHTELHQLFLIIIECPTCCIKRALSISTVLDRL